jgi:ElaB/YqjD/DUF883 family membrane-anchored ribosome-binding protein
MVRKKELNLFKSGVLVDLNIFKWNAQTKLNAEDLGLKEEDLSTLMKLGTKYLVDKKYIAPFVNLDAAARRILSYYSIKFPIGDTAFVPIANFDKLMQELDSVKQEFEEYKKMFIEHYEEMKKEALKEYENYSKQLQARNNWTEEQRKEFIEKIKACYKTKEELENKIRFEILVYRIDVDTELEIKNIEEFRKQIMDKVSNFVSSISSHIVNEIKELYNDLLNRKKTINENLYTIIERRLNSLRNLNITDDPKIDNLINSALAEIKTWINKNIDDIKDKIKEALDKANEFKIEEPRLKILL